MNESERVDNLGLRQLYITRINRIKRKLIEQINKIEKRDDIKDFVNINHIENLKKIDITINRLELQVLNLQNKINVFMNVERNISDDIIQEIDEDNKTDAIIQKFLPYMLYCYMNVDNQRNNSIDDLD
jgi:hypothetical protein